MIFFFQVFLVLLLSVCSILEANYLMLILAVLLYIMIGRVESLIQRIKNCEPWWY